MNGALFQGITESEYREMMHCFHADKKVYHPDQIICTYGDERRKIGILSEGEASLIRIQEDGRQTLLEYLHAGDIFGEPLSVFSSKTDIIQVVCSKTCCVEFIDYYHLTKRCPKACSFHSTLVSNVLHLLSLKAVHLSERLDILSQRTIREKLLRCFTLMAADQQADCSFTLPFSLGTLADYLCVDRSAMMREIGKMKKEGILQMDRRNITLSDPICHKAH